MSRRLLLDVMLGKLATYLRMCGYDTLYAQEEGIEADDALAALAESEGRTLVTRDQELAERTDGAALLSSREIEDQLAELHEQGFRIELPDQPERCSVCNGRVRALGEDESRPGHAPDGIEEIWQCRDCEQYFWKGSHWDRVTEVVGSADSNP
ncbi:hypothetical protein GRX03_02980 [Halovenus sp. WSH3]|uniref:Mut7-C RNAse domain-containing protein n=1 Tax=Halovenus carboxidivorans TaxID=2692199 RepID=A0A6B0T4W7_9EURY|nr:Mut7-C RNAse domain-containing protein [Halovenus carboxidivorans]MXR50573.1 hypothetical protein [Halovenus carboxidivorans]